MIEIPFFLAEAIFTLIWFLVRIAFCINQKVIDWRREAFFLLMYINWFAIIRFVFFPMDCVNGHVLPLVLDTASIFPLKINLIPFVNLFDYENKRDLLLNVIGNAAMFIPNGLLLPLIFKHLNNFWRVVCVGVALSLFIEVLQLPFSVRESDVDDLILNVLGVAIGYAIFVLIRNFVFKKDGSK